MANIEFFLRITFKSRFHHHILIGTKEILEEEWRDNPDYSFTDRDLDVLNVISEESLTNFTFDGLKRRLGLHSETLSRTLNRLEDQALIEKDSKGYRVASKIKKENAVHSLDVSKSSVPILQTLLSPEVSTQTVISSLSGKWFGILRWFGRSERRSGITLKWITEDGAIQIDANFSKETLSVEAKLLRKADIKLALNASYQLIAYIAQFYSKLCRARSVAYLASYQPYAVFA